MTDLVIPVERPPCQVPPDGVIVIRPGAGLAYGDCDFPPGTSFRFYYEDRMDTDTSPTQPVKTQELVAEPPALQPMDPAQLQQIGGDNPLLALGLAAIAVLGGGAAWKHYAKTSEQRHEQAMKQLEIQASAPTVQPPPCQAADAATQARIQALEARVAKAEKSTLSVGGLPDDLEERLEALEKKAKRGAK